MIVLYDTTETKFTSNGLGLLDHDIINPIIEESANGTFKLSFDYPLSGICGSRIGRRMYIKADDPDTEGNIFKIYNIEKSDGMLSIIAFQVANEFNNNWIEHTNIMGKNGQSALDQMKSNLTNSTRFNFYSDIDSTANSEIVRLNPLTWLIDSSTDNSFVNRWGGEIKRDGFNIRIFKQRGSNNGVQIRWRKNLSSYNVKWDDTTVVTRIRPIGYNGLTLPELYVDSPKLADYGDPIIKEIKYESVKVADENSSSDDNIYKTVDEAYTALRKLAAKEFNENHIDDPTVTADVSMISLKNTREYADVAELETIKQWDTIQLINERDNVDIQMRLNSYKYNPLNHEFTELKFISVNQSLKSGNTSLSTVINGISSTVQSVSDTANQAQIAANGKNMIQRGDANPNDLTFNGTLTDGDIYWRSNGNKTEMWIYSAKDKAWGLVVDDATGIKADQAQATADGKNTISYTDTAPANPKVNDVWFEEKSDGTIITNIWNGTKWEAPTSSEVKQTQVDLESKIAEAQADVNKKIANTQANLDEAKQNSAQLISDAQTELNTQADELKTVKQNAEDALNKSNGNSSSITDINADISKINGSLTIKANKSDIDAVNKTVLSQQNQITANTEGLQLKADKTSVDTLSQTVTNQTAQIAVLNDEVAEKTAKTDFDNLTGRVTSAEQKVTANADGLNSTVSKMSTLQDQVNNSAVGTNLLLGTKDLDPINWYINGTKVNAQKGATSDTNLSNSWRSDITILHSWADWNSYRLVTPNDIVLTVGETYTVSVYARSYTGTSTSGFALTAYEEGGAGLSGKDLTNQITTTFQQYSVTFKATSSNLKTFRIEPHGNWTNVGGSVYMYGFKLEKGSTATDYSTNPADNATVTSVTSVSQKADQIAADLATSNGDITQLKARATGWDSSIASANGKINTLQATSDGYATNISAIQNQVNNSAVGTNLLSGTNSDWKTHTFTSGDWGTGDSFTLTSDDLEPNTYYVFQTEVKASNASKYHVEVAGYDSSGTSSIIGNGALVVNSGLTYVIFNTGSLVKFNFRPHVRSGGASAGSESVQWRHEKLEKGNVVTDWCLAPEDAATTNYVNNQITATASTLSANLTSTTTTLKTYADNSATNAKNAAISTASSDATTKANAAQSNAIASAKTYADTQISATAGTFNVKTSAIQTQLDNSAVGTNLLLGTKSMDYMGSSTAGQGKWSYDTNHVSVNNGLVHVDNSTMTSGFTDICQIVKVSPSTTYTYSIQLRHASKSSTYGQFVTLYALEYKDAGTTTTSSYNDHNFIIGNSDQRKYTNVSFTTQSDCQYIKVYIRVFYGYIVNFETPKLEQGSVLTDWCLNPSDTNYTNMFTMDSNGITLDAHGVNNSNKTILLRGDHVKIDSSNPVVIPTINANVITSGTLDASKITVNKLSANSITSGTLNAANVNVINLNANNISSGTLTGVTFHQTSSGHDTYIDGNGMHDYDSSGNNAWINQGKLQVYDSNNQGFFMRAGSLQLTTQALWNSNANPLYGTIERDNNLFSQSKNGMQLVGANGVHIQTANSGWSGVSESQLLANGTAGTSIALNDNGDIAIGAAHLIQMYGGYQYTNGVNVKPVLSVGCSGTTENAAGSDMLLAARTISLAAGGNVTVTSGGFVTGGSAKIGNNFSVVGATDLRGSLSVAGSKNAIVQTSQGWAKINAYETAEYYFGDIGKINTGNGSKAKIVMDSLFLETVNTNVDYHVFLSSYGNGYAWVSEQGKDYFIIESNVPNLEVSYEVKAKRIGYEGTRLEIDEDFGKNSN
ncbi:phage tail spike protein [Liquorilactobacillus mali]|uniref:Tail spike domain-containing protein n=1 Tax=Liquorilactobacillus mali TaxID=1618 RepID=A0A0R2G234_9LACO|nr:phage tail spike protein [Liquorilactobacillus mali]KRN31639.1 hypothetical protein IV36_GL001763 [Liquorilactobacillus mali]